MPTDCPHCDAYLLDDEEKNSRVLDTDDLDNEDWHPIGTSLECLKCGFKWRQWYTESEWAPLDEYLDLKAAYVTFYSPKKPYKILHKDSMP